MVALPQRYNVSDRDERGGALPLIPQGRYQAVIVNSELKPTKGGAGQALVLKVVITQGQYQNTEFDEWINIVNANNIAVKIAYDTLAEISKAMNMAQTPADSSELHNKPLMIEIETEPGKEYTDDQGNKREGKDRSIIKKYLPLPAGGVQTPPASSPASAPAAAPVQAPAQEAAAPAAATPPPNNPFAPPQ